MQMTLPARRAFIVPSEVPGLLLGSLRREAAALRRILGARRGGRFGLGMVALALAAATPSWAQLPILVGLHGVLSVAVLLLQGKRHALGPLQQQRLSLWTVSPLLVALAPLRWFWPDSVLPAVLAVLSGYAVLWRGLRRGLD